MEEIERLMMQLDKEEKAKAPVKTDTNSARAKEGN
jgi:hypothetical protein